MNRFMRKCVVDRKIVEKILLKKSFNEIEKSEKVGKRRIRWVHDQAKKMGYLDGTPMPPPPEKLFDYPEKTKKVRSNGEEIFSKHKKWITAKIKEEGWHKITIYEELELDKNDEKPSLSSFYRYLQRHNIEKSQETKRVIPEIIHAPGEALQLDWGKVRDVIDPKTGKKRTLWALVGVMGFSRYMMVHFVWDNKTETTLNVIQQMFNELGGVPERIISDNPKCFALEASKYEPKLNPAFDRFCHHYGVLAEILPPYDPEKKGKVERSMPYVRRLFEAYGKDWTTLEDAQRYMNIKVNKANERVHGTTRLHPIHVFLQEEVNSLKSLPSTAYQMEEYHSGTVRKDGHVRFCHKYYSVDEQYIGNEVFVIGNQSRVQIYCNCELIETHERLTAAHRSKSTKKHHLKPWEQVMEDASLYLERAEKIGPSTKELIFTILKAGRGFIDTRKVWGILNLDKDHHPNKVDQACKYALEIDSLNYQTVKSYLNYKPAKAINTELSEENKFIRSMMEYQKYLH